MRNAALTIIETAALAAGLPNDLESSRVMTESAKDNLTLPRPRIELQYLTETYRRSGKVLQVQRDLTTSKPLQRRQRELYEVTLPIVAHVLADNDSWLDAFCYNFTAKMPKGFHDTRGLWVKVRVQKAEFAGYAAKRVGMSAIEIFTKRSRLFTIDFTWRVVAEEVTNLLTDFTINPKIAKA